MAQSIALMALAALGFFCASSHEPSHVDGGQKPIAVTERSGQSPPQRRDLPWSGKTVEQVEQDSRASRLSSTSSHCRIGPYLDQADGAPRVAGCAVKLSQRSLAVGFRQKGVGSLGGGSRLV